MCHCVHTYIHIHTHTKRTRTIILSSWYVEIGEAMSSFKRKVKVVEPTGPSSMSADDSTTIAAEMNGGGAKTALVTVAPISGVKPWIHTGLGMMSSGHRELDSMLHGGFASGSIVAFYLDSYSNYSDTLLMYSIAEGISHGQRCLVCSIDDMFLDQVFQSLPFNLSYDKIHGTSKKTADLAGTENTNTNDHGLKIAWQYEKYLAKNTIQNSNKLLDTAGLSYCCSYDLSRRLQSKILDNGSLIVQKLNIDDHIANPQQQFNALLEQLLQLVKQFLVTEYQQNSRAASRIFLPHFHQLCAPYLLTNQLPALQVYQSLTRFLLSLRQLVSDARVVVHLSVLSPRQSILPIDFYSLLHIATDVILDVESFAGHFETIPSEFKDFIAFFRVPHLRQRGVLATPTPNATKYGVKRDRRKLRIELLHLPPEESRAMSSSNSINCSSTSSSSASVNASGSMKMANLLGLTAQQEHLEQQRRESSHSHDHSHQHSHSHRSLQHIQLELEIGKTSVDQDVSDSTDSPAPRSTALAAALASARAARAAAAAGASVSTPVAVAPLDLVSDEFAASDEANSPVLETIPVKPISIQSASIRTTANKLSSLQKKSSPSIDF